MSRISACNLQTVNLRVHPNALVSFLNSNRPHVAGAPASPQSFQTMQPPIAATHSRPVQYSQNHAYGQGTPTPPPPIPSSPRGRGLVEPYRPLGPLPPRTVRAVARLGPHPVADGHLVDVAALAAPPCGFAANCLHAGGLQALVHARVPTSTDRTETRVKMSHLHRTRTPVCNFWAVSQAEPARNATIRRCFLRSAKPAANNCSRKPHRSPDPWRNRRPFPAKPSRSRGNRSCS